MDASHLATPLAALVAGLVTSVHCVGMCGPLVCSMRAQPGRYHATRAAAYTLVGAGCGAVGQSFALLFRGTPMWLAPIGMALVLLALAFGLERRLPQPRIFARWMLRARLGESLGWFTPLLPCGPLWLMFGVAAVSGSWWRGAGLLGAFAAGTVPLAWLAQAQVLRLQGSLSPNALRWTQQALALTSAALLLWRATSIEHGSCH